MIRAPSIGAAIWLGALSVGAVAGLAGAVLLWPLVGLGWWTLALPVVGAGGVLAYGLVERGGRR